MIAAFQSNVRNRRIRSKMNVWLPKTVKELYTLVDKCARVEEGRKHTGEVDCVDIDLEEDKRPLARRRRMRSTRIKQ